VVFENFYCYVYNKENKLKIVRCIKVKRAKRISIFYIYRIEKYEAGLYTKNRK
jgi:hypothetical protein